ncbi:MAG: hypothetical protein E7348_00165 [Clostridiales bacterium]|nr:hypothetical protein [Clostridiales bacterium]
MEFNLPTTKAQMYVVLNDLFYYYRIRREGFQGINLLPLDLDKMSTAVPTDTELNTTANTLLSASHEREIKNYQQEISLEITEIQTKIDLVNQNSAKQVDEVNQLYEQSLKKIQGQIASSGLINSSIIIDKTAQLEQEKNAKITEINLSCDSEVASLTAKKTALEKKLDDSSTYFSSIHSKEKTAKVVELKEDRKKLSNEIFKYNNAIEEKIQRYDNSLKEINASFELRFLDITSGEITHDQLVEMGYYEDVIRCVCGYYDTLNATDAFYDISSERKLAIYLDEYYTEIVYTYKVRAGI